MMIKLVWPEYRMFEYERDLSLREAVALTGMDAEVDDDGIKVLGRDLGVLMDRITYAHVVTLGDENAFTAQATVESRHLSRRSSQQNRQATRYLVHGVHEYKGKFNPQLAR